MSDTLARTKELFKLGCFKEAIAVATNALAIWKDQQSQILLVRAECWFKIGEIQKALCDTDKVIGLQHNWDDAWNLRGVILTGEGKDAEAFGCFQNAIK